MIHVLHQTGLLATMPDSELLIADSQTGLCSVPLLGSHLLPNEFLSFGFFCQISHSVRFVVDLRQPSEVVACAIVRKRLSKCSLS